MVGLNRSLKYEPKMNTTPATETLKSAIEQYGTPDIFSSDHGSQCISFEHMKLLKDHGIQI